MLAKLQNVKDGITNPVRLFSNGTHSAPYFFPAAFKNGNMTPKIKTKAQPVNALASGVRENRATPQARLNTVLR